MALACFSTRGWKVLVAACALVAVSAMDASGQTTGGIAGRIIDASNNKPVENAVVIAQSPALQGEQTGVTDKSGHFSITLLPSGIYQLIVQRQGYQVLTRTDLKVDLDRMIRVKLKLVRSLPSAQGRTDQIERPTPRK
jgi:hypothetical protein